MPGCRQKGIIFFVHTAQRFPYPQPIPNVCVHFVPSIPKIIAITCYQSHSHEQKDIAICMFVCSLPDRHKKYYEASRSQFTHA
jgi:hypothetical protein